MTWVMADSSSISVDNDRGSLADLQREDYNHDQEQE